MGDTPPEGVCPNHEVCGGVAVSVLVDGELVGGLILSGQRWDLGHVDGDDPFTYSGAEHAACNRATNRRPEPSVKLRERSDGYLEDAAGCSTAPPSSTATSA